MKLITVRWSTTMRRQGELLKEYHDPQRDATRRERERERVCNMGELETVECINFFVYTQ